MCNEPAGSFRKENIVGVIWSSLDERNASVVFPVPHCLLKQRLVTAYTNNAHSIITLFITTERRQPVLPPLLESNGGGKTSGSRGG